MRTNVQLRHLFNQTFDALPSEARSKIEELWRKYSIPTEKKKNVDYFRPPVLKITTLEPPSRCAETDGLFFHFKASVVDNAPDDTLKILIAHELAHAYRAGSVGLPFPEGQFVLGTTESEEEEKVNALIKQWGFDHNELVKWLDFNKAPLGLNHVKS